jgi:hypothetical protein
MRRLLCLALLFCMTLPRLARADDESADTEVTHYHHLTLGVDGASLAVLVAGGLAEGEGGRDTTASSTLMPIGLLGMTFGTPIVHLTRGHTGRALGSFALRVAFASGGMLVAEAARSCNPDEDFLCKLDYVGYGMVGGLVLASLFDAATMTEERVPRRGPTWAPSLSATPGGARVGIAGTF